MPRLFLIFYAIPTLNLMKITPNTYTLRFLIIVLGLNTGLLKTFGQVIIPPFHHLLLPKSQPASNFSTVYSFDQEHWQLLPPDRKIKAAEPIYFAAVAKGTISQGAVLESSALSSCTWSGTAERCNQGNGSLTFIGTRPNGTLLFRLYQYNNGLLVLVNSNQTGVFTGLSVGEYNAELVVNGQINCSVDLSVNEFGISPPAPILNSVNLGNLNDCVEGNVTLALNVTGSGYPIESRLDNGNWIQGVSMTNLRNGT